MQNSGPLVILGFAILIAAALNIIVPYLRGKSDILSAWNILWLGGALFTGVGSLAVAYGNFHWPQLQWFQPTRSDVARYIYGSIAFYGTMLVCYHVLSWPKRFVARFFNKWPPMKTPLVMTYLGLFGLIAIGAAVSTGVFFFGPLLMNMVHKALIFASVFSFCYWYRDRRNVVKLVLFLGVFAFALLDSMVLFHGRRLLLSVAVVPVVCLYWLHWRNLSPKKNLAYCGVATLTILAVAIFYSSFRHFDRYTEQRTMTTTIEAIRGASPREAIESVTGDMFNYFAQYCTHYSLLTIQLLDTGQVEVEPLNTLAFLATYPVPRVIFPSKPESLGSRMVSQVLRLPYRTNWGLGIVAYGYQEGGLLVIMLYALLIVLGTRLLDDALVRQPDNPFLLSILSATAPHFAALIRGDPTNMSAEILEAFVFAWALGFVARFFVGTLPVVRNLGASPNRYSQLRGQFRQFER